MNEALFLSLSHSNKIPTIDLHGSSGIVEALEMMEKELFSFSKRKDNFVKVIYGIGEGVLKERVVESVKNHPLIKSYHIGEDGFCIVEL